MNRLRFTGFLFGAALLAVAWAAFLLFLGKLTALVLSVLAIGFCLAAASAHYVGAWVNHILK
jgi:hypothetical protein